MAVNAIDAVHAGTRAHTAGGGLVVGERCVRAMVHAASRPIAHAAITGRCNAVAVKKVFSSKAACRHISKFGAHEPLGVCEQLFHQIVYFGQAVLRDNFLDAPLSYTASAYLRCEIALALLRGPYICQEQRE